MLVRRLNKMSEMKDCMKHSKPLSVRNFYYFFVINALTLTLNKNCHARVLRQAMQGARMKQASVSNQVCCVFIFSMTQC